MSFSVTVNNVVDALELSADEFDGAVDAAVSCTGGWNGFADTLAQAFRDGNESILFCAHKLLNGIYRVITLVPQAGTATPERSTSLARLRNRIECEFMAHLNKQIAPFMLTAIPVDLYAEWLRDLIALHPAANHRLYTRYLADEATVEDIRHYLLQESAIDANTDDFLASLQIGAPSVAKAEIAANFWDEMGEGNHNLIHSDLFKKVLKSLSISTTETQNALTLEALVCGNLQTMLSLRRDLFYYGVGYFAATEQLVPERFEALERGWERVALPRMGADYHLLHIEIDSHHTDRWYRNVVTPLASMSTGARREMLIGALYRLVTSDRYLSGLLAHFRSDRAILA